MIVKTPLLLDGAMGQEIVRRGGNSQYGAWGVAALLDQPQLVRDIHREYIVAGADVITTNSYSATRTRLRHRSMEDRLAEMVQIAGQLAVDARAAAGQPEIKIAGSIGPLEASYISTLQLSFQQMVEEFRELMTLHDPHVDLYLGETFSTTLEARAFLAAAQGREKPAWVSWTLEDQGGQRLRSGETIAAAIASIADFAPQALLLNCCTPDSIDNSIAQLAAAGLPYGAYANGFVNIPDDWEQGTDPGTLEGRHDLPPPAYAQHVQSWLAQGASIVGGCCEIGPQHIAHLRQMLDAQR